MSEIAIESIVITAVVAVVFIAIGIYYVTHSNKQGRRERLHKRLGSMALELAELAQSNDSNHYKKMSAQIDKIILAANKYKKGEELKEGDGQVVSLSDYKGRSKAAGE